MRTRRHRHRHQLAPHDRGAGPPRPVLRGHRPRKGNGPAGRRRARRAGAHARGDARGAAGAVEIPPAGRIAPGRRDHRRRHQRDARSRERRRVPAGDHRSRPASAPRVISGTEEARLIHLAAVYGVSVPGDVAVVIDIGGGSVEITRGTGPAIELGRSFKLGVIRLTERFVKTRSARRRATSASWCGTSTPRSASTSIRSRSAGFDRVIGTSGTILSLGAVAVGGRRARRRRAAAQPPRPGQAAPPRAQGAGRARPREAAARARASSRGAPTSRSPARSCSTTILRRLGADEITLCDLSLREGLVLDYIARHRKEIAQADRYPDVRRRSVFELAERCNYWPEHAQQVARLARRRCSIRRARFTA